MYYEKTSNDGLLGYFNGKLYWLDMKYKRSHFAGCYRDDGYYLIVVNNVIVRGHRIIWEMFNGEIPKGMEIDHADRNPKNNLISNLRLCTSNENKHNSKMKKSNTSGAKGVGWNVKNKCWQVQVMCNRKMTSVSGFWDIYTAELTAKRIRNELHGKFANHGQGDQDELSRYFN